MSSHGGKLKKDFSDIGQRLKQWRISKGLTQQDIAKVLDIQRASVSSIEIGANAITTKSLVILHEKYNLPINYILLGDDLNNLPDFGVFNKKVMEMLEEMKNSPVYLHTLLGCFEQKKFELENIKEKGAKND
jgi:transcriptional regulator with XRE-family HTH domain